jgi:hypothetical protein
MSKSFWRTAGPGHGSNSYRTDLLLCQRISVMQPLRTWRTDVIPLFSCHEFFVGVRFLGIELYLLLNMKTCVFFYIN